MLEVFCDEKGHIQRKANLSLLSKTVMHGPYYQSINREFVIVSWICFNQIW